MVVRAGKRELIEPKTKETATSYSRRSFVSRLGLFCCALPVTAVRTGPATIALGASAFSVGQCRRCSRRSR